MVVWISSSYAPNSPRDGTTVQIKLKRQSGYLLASELAEIVTSQLTTERYAAVWGSLKRYAEGFATIFVRLGSGLILPNKNNDN